MGSRPRPVLIVTMALAGLGAVTGFAGLTDLVPAKVVLWLALVNAVAIAMSGVYLQAVVTPLSDPRSADGRRLVPAEPAQPPSGTADDDPAAPRSGLERPGRESYFDGP